MGMLGCNNVTPCGDIYLPPSRTNRSLFSIIQIVVMIVVSVFCLYELIDIIDHGDFTNTKTLALIDDIIIVAGICYLLYGLFFAASSRNIRIGILLFVIGAILAMVIIALEIHYGTREIWLKIFQFIVLLFLSFILWQQAARL